MNEEIFEKWKATRMMDGLDDSQVRPMISCLEAQRLINCLYQETEVKNHANAVWLRLVIPMVRRIFAKTRNRFQCDLENMFKQHCDLCIFQSKFVLPDFNSYFALETEADVCALLCLQLTAELDELFSHMNKPVDFYGFTHMNETIMMWYGVNSGYNNNQSKYA